MVCLIQKPVVCFHVVNVYSARSTDCLVAICSVGIALYIFGSRKPNYVSFVISHCNALYIASNNCIPLVCPK